MNPDSMNQINLADERTEDICQKHNQLKRKHSFKNIQTKRSRQNTNTLDTTGK